MLSISSTVIGSQEVFWYNHWNKWAVMRLWWKCSARSLVYVNECDREALVVVVMGITCEQRKS